MVCQECGVNTAITSGHSPMCSQYIDPKLSSTEFDELKGVDAETSSKMRQFGDAINDVVIERGEKPLIAFLASIGIVEGDPGYEDLKTLAHICLSLGAGTAIQIMLEQDILDQAGLRRAAGV